MPCLELDDVQVNELLLLVGRCGSVKGCARYSRESGIPSLLLEAYVHRIGRASNALGPVRHRRTYKVIEANEAEIAEEEQRADIKLQKLAHKAFFTISERRGKSTEVVNRGRLELFAQAYMNDVDAGCSARCFRRLDRHLRGFIEEMIDIVGTIARERHRLHGSKSHQVDASAVESALHMNGDDSLKVSAEAAMACELLPMNFTRLRIINAKK